MFYKVNDLRTGTTYYLVYKILDEPDGHFCSHSVCFCDYDDSQLFTNGIIAEVHGKLRSPQIFDKIKHVNQNMVEIIRFTEKEIRNPQIDVDNLSVLMHVPCEDEGDTSYYYRIKTTVKATKSSQLRLQICDDTYRINLVQGFQYYIKCFKYDDEPQLVNNSTIHPYYHLMAAINPKIFYEATKFYGWERHTLPIFPIKPEYNKPHFDNWLALSKWRQLGECFKDYEVEQLYDMTISELMELSNDKFNMFHFLWFNMPFKFASVYKDRDFRTHYQWMSFDHYNDKLYYPDPDYGKGMPTRDLTKVSKILSKCPEVVSDEVFKEKFYKFDYFLIWARAKPTLNTYLTHLKIVFEKMVGTQNVNEFNECYRELTDFDHFKAKFKNQRINYAKKKLAELTKETEKMKKDLARWEKW